MSFFGFLLLFFFGFPLLWWLATGLLSAIAAAAYTLFIKPLIALEIITERGAKEGKGEWLNYAVAIAIIGVAAIFIIKGLDIALPTVTFPDTPLPSIVADTYHKAINGKYGGVIQGMIEAIVYPLGFIGFGGFIYALLMGVTNISRQMEEIYRELGGD